MLEEEKPSRLQRDSHAKRQFLTSSSFHFQQRYEGYRRLSDVKKKLIS